MFGQVLAGQDLIRQVEQLPVDRNSRPLQDVVISNCGELVKQVKGKLKHFWHIHKSIIYRVHFLCSKKNKKRKEQKA